MQNQQRTRGFTLIELLVVIAIIAILAAILFPVFARAREKGRQMQCTANVRQQVISLQMYVQDHDSTFPDAASLWGEVKLPPASLACPSYGVKRGNGYGFNLWLCGQNPLDKSYPDASKLLVITDATTQYLTAVSSIDFRHGDRAVVGFYDGHVALLTQSQVPDFKVIPMGSAKDAISTFLWYKTTDWWPVSKKVTSFTSNNIPTAWLPDENGNFPLTCTMGGADQFDVAVPPGIGSGDMNAFIYAPQFISTGGRNYASPVITTLTLPNVAMGDGSAWLLSIPRIHHMYAGSSLDPSFAFSATNGPVKLHEVVEVLDTAQAPIVNLDISVEPNMTDGTKNTLSIKANNTEIAHTYVTGVKWTYAPFANTYVCSELNSSYNNSISFLANPGGTVEVSVAYPNGCAGTLSVTPLSGANAQQPKYLRITSSTGVAGGEGRGTFGIYNATNGGGVWLASVDLSHP